MRAARCGGRCAGVGSAWRSSSRRRGDCSPPDRDRDPCAEHPVAPSPGSRSLGRASGRPLAGTAIPGQGNRSPPLRDRDPWAGQPLAPRRDRPLCRTRIFTRRLDAALSEEAPQTIVVWTDFRARGSVSPTQPSTRRAAATVFVRGALAPGTPPATLVRVGSASRSPRLAGRAAQPSNGASLAAPSLGSRTAPRDCRSGGGSTWMTGRLFTRRDSLESGEQTCGFARAPAAGPRSRTRLRNLRAAPRGV
jgi:hypothetical protein